MKRQKQIKEAGVGQFKKLLALSLFLQVGECSIGIKDASDQMRNSFIGHKEYETLTHLSPLMQNIPAKKVLASDCV